MPQTPDDIYQNDLDLRDMVNTRIGVAGNKVCIDNPTLCVDRVDDQVELSTGSATKPVLANRNNDDTGFFFPMADKISALMNGATAWYIQGIGAIRQPLQPCFSATLSASTENVTGNGTSYIVGWDTERFDYNGDFANRTFTAPITAVYLFLITISLDQLDADLHNTIDISLVTSNWTYALGDQTISATARPRGISVPVLADMDAGDTATVVITVGGGTKSVDVLGTTKSHFSGSLIN